MKLLTTTALTLALAAPAFAGHVQNGWRDTGCDEAANVYIYGKDGNVLYLNNPTCPNAQGGMDPLAEEDDEEIVVEEPGDETPVDDVPVEEEVVALK